jgi:hypothetical protein
MKRFTCLFLSLLFLVGCSEKDQVEGIPRMKIYIDGLVSYEYFDTELEEGESSLLLVETESSSYLYCVQIDDSLVYEKFYKPKSDEIVYPYEVEAVDGLWQVIQIDERTFICKVEYNVAANHIIFEFGDLENCKGPGEFSLQFMH